LSQINADFFGILFRFAAMPNAGTNSRAARTKFPSRGGVAREARRGGLVEKPQRQTVAPERCCLLGYSVRRCCPSPFIDIQLPNVVYQEKTMRVSKWGNSLAVRLPAALVSEMTLREGDDVEIIVRKKNDPLENVRRLRGLMPADFRFNREDIHDRNKK
jgi:antitoxin MazE